jgi:hypothetical protein
LLLWKHVQVLLGQQSPVQLEQHLSGQVFGQQGQGHLGQQPPGQFELPLQQALVRCR